MQTHNTSAIVTVGKGKRVGRGFVIEIFKRRLVITAAHCLPKLPRPHPVSYNNERTFECLGPFDSKPSIWAECLFADPVADIAVLGSPDNQVYDKQADDYEVLVENATPLPIGRLATRRGIKTIGEYKIEIDLTFRTEMKVMGLDGEMISGTARWRAHRLALEVKAIASGMSGSPIIAADHAIGVVVCDPLGPHPRLDTDLPGWLCTTIDGVLIGEQTPEDQ